MKYLQIEALVAAAEYIVRRLAGMGVTVSVAKEAIDTNSNSCGIVRTLYSDDVVFCCARRRRQLDCFHRSAGCHRIVMVVCIVLHRIALHRLAFSSLYISMHIYYANIANRKSNFVAPAPAPLPTPKLR